MRTRLIPISMVCCLMLAACSSGNDTASTSVASSTTIPIVTQPSSTTPLPPTSTTLPLVLEGATVIVANGNIVGGSAGRMTDALAVAGFTVGAATNGAEKIDDSIVYYTAADGAQAVAESVAVTLGGVSVLPLPDPIPTESGTLEGGDVLVLLGNNQADKTLGEVGTSTPVEPIAAGSSIVVANANSIGGSAGRMAAQLETAGFTVGVPTNANTTVTDSVVYYTDSPAAGDDAEALAAALGGVEVLPLPATVPTESGTLDGDILLLLGSAEADRTLAELAG